MKPRTNDQNRMLHYLFNRLGFDADMKAAIVEEFTGNRTSKSSEMSFDECHDLISTLNDSIYKDKRQKADNLQKKRREVFKLMYDCGFINNTMSSDEKQKAITHWIKNRLVIPDRDINGLSAGELEKLIRQLKTVRRIYAERASKANLN